ncbi:uncharacterized protein RSE6_01409 [Rhynchosporium secalis]|uniref:Uncharacterized protein n=1 Tax=Rhynchosporium secalis TaxID=38038 RepID=A0A1E1LXR6_RHYSE|nr:uncharacterized protein RSE6_01409 [Rhynchosporium secalis]
MPADILAAVEVVPSQRRRASTNYSTGLDYSSCLLVDEDIISRIHSVLVPRNDYWPSRSPSTPDEPSPQEPETRELVSGFDFGSAKSVAKLARQATRRLSVPEIRGVQSNSIMADLEQNTTQPLKSILRVSNSANNLKDSAGNPSPSEPRGIFRIPKLVLRDIKPTELEGIKSCVEINPIIPDNDAELHENELDCCPPCDPDDSQPSKYLVKHSNLPTPGLEIEAADLACFMGGCEPGLKECPKHRRRSDSVSGRSPSADQRIEEDFKSIPEGLARMGFTANGLKSASKSLKGKHDYTNSELQNTTEAESKTDVRKPVAKSAGRARKSLRSPTERAMSPISSVTSGSTMDAFPLAVQSSELAEKERSPGTFSTAVATNFSLPGYKSKRASQSLRTKLAEISARADEGPASHTPNGVSIGGDIKFRQPRNSIPRKPLPSEGSVQESGGVAQDQTPSRFPSAFKLPSSNQEIDRKLSDVHTGSNSLGSPASRELNSESHNAVREKKSEASLKSNTASMKTKPYSTSLLSETSRTSVIRHALLKSPMTEFQPLDNGLPVPPLLSAISSLSEKVRPSELAYSEVLKSAGSDGKGKSSQRETEYFDTSETMDNYAKGNHNLNISGAETSGMAGGRPSKGAVYTAQGSVIDSARAQQGKQINREPMNGPSDRPVIGNTVPIAGHLTDLQRAKDLVDSVRGRIQEAEEQIIHAMASEKHESHGPTTSRSVDSISLVRSPAEDTLPAVSKPGKSIPASASRPVSPKSHELGECQFPDNANTETAVNEVKVEHGDEWGSPFNPRQNITIGQEDNLRKLDPVSFSSKDTVIPPSYEGNHSEHPRPIQSQSSRPPMDTSNAEYWGFVPAVQEAVQDAVQIAVRKAVQDIVVPPGTDKSSNEYRQLVSASLTRASKNADEQIQCVAARKPLLPSDKESEATVILSGREIGQRQPKTEDLGSRKASTKVHATPAPPKASSPVHKSYPASISSRENDPGQGKDLSIPELSRTFLDPRPPLNTQQTHISPPRSFSPADLETIPLDADKTAPVDHSSQGWRLSKAPASKKGSSAKYTAIPTRHSSRNQVLSPKTKATNSSNTVLALGSLMGSRKRSYERLIPRGSRGLRSASSVGSLRSAGSADKDKDAVELAFLDQPPSHRKSMSSASLSVERLGRKNTVHWLKELLSSNGPYETRFTALPPRTKGARPVRSQTAPAKPVDDLYLGQTPRPLNIVKGVTKPQPSKAREGKRTDISETFTRTIKDLENLMNEALFIARQAADSTELANLQDGLEKSINILHDSQKNPSKGGAGSTLPSLPSRMQSRVPATRYSDSDLSDYSVHESLRSYSGSSESELTDDEDPPIPAHTRSVTVSANKPPSKNGSGWPPTGRVPTPYPPASFPQSRASTNVEARPDQDRKDSIRPIKAADPRSMRTETNVDITQMNTSRHQSMNQDGSTGMQPGPRRTTTVTIPPIRLEKNEERNENGDKPDFGTLEPFSVERRSSEHRKSSAKSPTRPTPERATNNSTIAEDSNGATRDTNNDPRGTDKALPLPQLTPRRGTDSVPVSAKEHSEEDHQAIRTKLAASEIPGKQESKSKFESGHTAKTGRIYDWPNIDQSKVEPSPGPETRGQTVVPEPKLIDPNTRRFTHSLDGSDMTYSEVLDFNTGYGVRHRGGGGAGAGAGAGIGGELSRSKSRPYEVVELRDSPDPNLPPTTKGERESKRNQFSLGGKRHVSLRDHHAKGFSLARSHKRQTIARDWSTGRKRFVATVACISTSLIGILVGIYAGETPAIQYYIVDFHHYTVLGNVFFFIGLAIPTFFFWPLPLLHGRKPYIMGALSLAMPLLFPQALAVGEFRSPYVARWRVGLILSRSLMGFCLGFANMNFKQMLTDLFGASLQSTNPHQEHVDEFDVRRHGGGMGVWLGLWTWSALGSIGLGFMIGAVIIDTLNPAWGFYVSICIIAFVMLLNVLCPEVRRSAFRRSVAEVLNEGGGDVSRRLARGEVKMHIFQTGPRWWGEEFHAGVVLSTRMVRQPGFLIMALYVAWIYGQQLLITLLLGALMSKDYKFNSPQVGAASLAIPVGALVAIPFQKASIFSRARQLAPVSDDGTIKKKISWTSHMLRRSIFVLCLPLSGIAYTLSSAGPPIPYIVPVLLAALVGFLSNLAMAECHGIIMETFDTSDLQPGMTGRSRGSAGSKAASKRTNYSSFPRVASGFAITQGFGYLVAAAASGIGGVLTRHLGQQAATGVMAGILLILSVLLLLSLIRYTDVQIIPDSKKDEMERYHNARRASAIRQQEGVQEEEPWRPIIIGNPHYTTRRMCLLELGSLSRFSEIRLKNKLVDEKSLEAKHPNQAAMNELAIIIHDKEIELVNTVRRSLSRHSSRGSRRSRSDNGLGGPEQGDLGGHREMLSRGGSGNGSGRPAALSRGVGDEIGERRKMKKTVTFASPGEGSVLAEEDGYSKYLSRLVARVLVQILEIVWKAWGARGGVQEVEESGGGFRGWYYRGSVYSLNGEEVPTGRMGR